MFWLGSQKNLLRTTFRVEKSLKISTRIVSSACATCRVDSSPGTSYPYFIVRGKCKKFFREVVTQDKQ